MKLPARAVGREAGEADYCGPHGRTRKAPAIRGLSRGQPLEVPIQTITPGQALGVCVWGGEAMLGVGIQLIARLLTEYI